MMRRPNPVLSLLPVAALLPLACQSSAPGVGPSGGADTDTADEPDGPSITDTAGSAGGSGTDGAGCEVDAACPDHAPVCQGGTCVACALDEACAARDGRVPVCVDGGCVECALGKEGACEDDAPVCTAEHACVPCSSHDECDVACELDTGRCIDRLLVVDGTHEADFASISEALETVEPGESVAIVVEPMEACYVDAFTVPSDRRVAFLGGVGDTPCITSLNDGPVLTLEDRAVAYLDRIRIERALGPGIAGTGAELWVSRSEVVNNQGGGIALSQESRLFLRNAIIGGDRNNVPAVSARDSDLDAVYATLAAGFGDAVALRCAGSGRVRIRNSILVSESSGGEIDCSGAVIKRSALESAYGSGNVAVGAVDTRAWFVDFGGGDLHLVPEQARMFEGVALRDAADPRVDIDGDPRPASDAGPEGLADWAGADIPSQ